MNPDELSRVKLPQGQISNPRQICPKSQTPMLGAQRRIEARIGQFAGH
jgi:hypothetical protein